MTILDFLLVLSIAGFVWFGFWYGIIHTFGGLVGTVAGAWLAGHYYAALAVPVRVLLGSTSGWVDLATFIFIYLVVNRVVGFAFFLLDRAFNFVSLVPFLKTINRLAGAALGLAEGVLVTGLTLYFASRIALPEAITTAIAGSQVAGRLMAVASVLVPLLPDLIRQVQPYVPGVPLPQ